MRLLDELWWLLYDHCFYGLAQVLSYSCILFIFPPPPFPTITMTLPPFSSFLACLFLIYILHPLPSSATRMTSPRLHRRQAAPPPAIINTTIHDQKGEDVTSSFKTMIFHQGLQNTSLPANLTDKKRSLTTRQVSYEIDYSEPHLMFRTILSCMAGGGPNWRFVRSECNHSHSMQAYTCWCRPYSREADRSWVWGKWCYCRSYPPLLIFLSAFSPISPLLFLLLVEFQMDENRY